MTRESYTPGHSPNATAFMERRSFESHGGFFAEHVEPTHRVLDVGCGPGTITLGIACRVAEVCAVDAAEGQIELARRRAGREGVKNVEFQAASCYRLPYEDGSFDRVFSHALLEHLAEPLDALAEFQRVLKPRGVLGVCSPDFRYRLLVPSSPQLEEAAEAYADLQSSNGGDLRIGHKLGGYLRQAGFEHVVLHARYECYAPLTIIGEYLALQLERSGKPERAACFRQWSQSPGGMFAQTWISAVGAKPR